MKTNIIANELTTRRAFLGSAATVAVATMVSSRLFAANAPAKVAGKTAPIYKTIQSVNEAIPFYAVALMLLTIGLILRTVLGGNRPDSKYLVARGFIASGFAVLILGLIDSFFALTTNAGLISILVGAILAVIVSNPGNFDKEKKERVGFVVAVVIFTTILTSFAHHLIGPVVAPLLRPSASYTMEIPDDGNGLVAMLQHGTRISGEHVGRAESIAIFTKGTADSEDVEVSGTVDGNYFKVEALLADNHLRAMTDGKKSTAVYLESKIGEGESVLILALPPGKKGDIRIAISGTSARATLYNTSVAGTVIRLLNADRLLKSLKSDPVLSTRPSIFTSTRFLSATKATTRRRMR